MRMSKNRLEAFSDAVIAIIITIMVLEMKVPHSTELVALKPLLPVFLTYVLSFIYLAIYWNNHHHLLHMAKHVKGDILWSNMHLLFWLSLLPFVTGWMGENHFSPLPTMAYGVVLLFSAIAYFILQNRIIASQGKKSDLSEAIGRDIKGKVSMLLYLVGILTSIYAHWIATAMYALVAIIWLIPDRRIERLAHD